DQFKDAPGVGLAFSIATGSASSGIPGVQRLLRAARALGLGSVPTTLHPSGMQRVYQLLGVPAEAEFHLCIPLGYPRGRFGPTQRRPTHETTFWNRWEAPVPWTAAVAAS